MRVTSMQQVFSPESFSFYLSFTPRHFYTFFPIAMVKRVCSTYWSNNPTENENILPYYLFGPPQQHRQLMLNSLKDSKTAIRRPLCVKLLAEEANNPPEL